MKFCHISDTHSTFPKINKDAEFIIHSGDFFPNFVYTYQGNLVQEAKFQEKWLLDNIEALKNQLNGRDFLFVLGNHDFLHPEIMEKILINNNVKAINLTNKLVNYKGIKLYGFPYIPYIVGKWNYEMHIGPMDDAFDVVLSIMNREYVDILVCHSPPANILDLCRYEHLGSTIIYNGLFYKLNKDMFPKYVLFGHIHEARGIFKDSGTIFSNSATTKNYFKI